MKRKIWWRPLTSPSFHILVKIQTRVLSILGSLVKGLVYKACVTPLLETQTTDSSRQKRYGNTTRISLKKWRRRYNNKLKRHVDFATFYRICDSLTTWSQQNTTTFKVNNGNTRNICEISSALTMKTVERVQGNCSLLLTLNRFHTLFWCFRSWLLPY